MNDAKADMERLIVSAPADEDFREKVFYLCPSDSIEILGEKTRPGSVYFGLFIAMDAHSVTDDSILQGAKKLLSQGLAFLSAWGPDCMRVHDLFDVAAREIESELSDDDTILTTWHSDQSLEEALWFFVHAASATAKFEKTCNDRIIAPISNPDWEQLIRSKFTQISRVIEDDEQLPEAF